MKTHLKLRTHKTTAKRFRVTGSGKLQHATSSAQHLRSKKTARELAVAKGYKIAAKATVKRVARLLPYA